MSEEIRIGIIGGSGLGERLAATIDAADRSEHCPQTPFGMPSAPIITGNFGEVPIALLQRHGEGHVFNPASVPYRANIFALKSLGCTHIIGSGACGSLREEIQPGDIVICNQLIDRTSGRVRTFYERAAVHVEFADPFCPVMRRWLLDTATRSPDMRVHPQAAYVCMEGPAFSTRAESHMHRAWGADIVGMTAIPEARLAREAEMAYALIGLPTDYDCWRSREDDLDQQSLIAEIISHLQRATDSALNLIREALSNVTTLRSQRSPAHDALSLGIWTAKTHVPKDEVERLRPLWGRHFP